MSRSKKIKKKNDSKYKILSSNIHYYRERLGMSLDELADNADISPSYLSALESPASTHNPSLEVLFDLSRNMNIEPYLLFMDLQAASSAYAAEMDFMMHMNAFSRKVNNYKSHGFVSNKKEDLVAEAPEFYSDEFETMSLKKIAQMTRKNPAAFLNICLTVFLKAFSEDDDEDDDYDCVITS